MSDPGFPIFLLATGPVTLVASLRMFHVPPTIKALILGLLVANLFPFGVAMAVGLGLLAEPAFLEPLAIVLTGAMTLTSIWVACRYPMMTRW